MASLSLLDPICLHMWIPSLLINFIFRPFNFFHPKNDLGLTRERGQNIPAASPVPSATTSSTASSVLNIADVLAAAPGAAHSRALGDGVAAVSMTEGVPATTLLAGAPAGPSQTTPGSAARSSCTVTNTFSAGSVLGSACGGVAQRRAKACGEAGMCLLPDADAQQPCSKLGAVRAWESGAGCAERGQSGQGPGVVGGDDGDGKAAGLLGCGAGSARFEEGLLDVLRTGSVAKALEGLQGVCSLCARTCSVRLRGWLAWGWSYVPVPHVGRLIKVRCGTAKHWAAYGGMRYGAASCCCCMRAHTGRALAQEGSGGRAGEQPDG